VSSSASSRHSYARSPIAGPAYRALNADAAHAGLHGLLNMRRVREPVSMPLGAASVRCTRSDSISSPAKRRVKLETLSADEGP